MGRTYRRRKSLANKRIEMNHSSFDFLVKFCRKHNFGVGPDRLRPFTFSCSGRGLQATRNISAGELLIQIPQNLLIISETALNHPVITESFENINNDVQFSAMSLIAAYLLIEESYDNASSIASYLETLPTAFTNLICIEDRIRGPILDELFSTEVENMRFKVERDYQLALQLLHSVKPLPDFDRFLWAWLVINSRSVFMKQTKHQRISGEDNFSLAPFLDLLNHSHSANITAGFNSATNSYEIITHDSYTQYDQVFINYGSHCNRKLLLDYGFILTNNSNNVIPLSSSDLVDALNSIMPAHTRINGTKLAEELNRNNLNQGMLFDSDGASWNLREALKALTSAEFLADSCQPLAGSVEVSSKDILFSLIRKKMAVLRDYHDAVQLALGDTSLKEATDLTLSMLLQVYTEEMNMLENARDVWENS